MPDENIVAPKPKVWFTADLHWGEERLHLFHRPFKSAHEFVTTIIKNWNSVVGEEDEVYVLGDVAVEQSWLQYLSLLNGTKHLIKGNYDTFGDEVYRVHFASVVDNADMIIRNNDGVELFVHLDHYPTRSIASSFGLCGHIHSAWMVQKNLLNVGVDPFHFMPVSVEQVFLCFKQICEIYDEDVWCANHPANVAHSDRGKKGTYWETGFSGNLQAEEAPTK